MKRNVLLDLCRAILTIMVLLYHLGLCEGGYLAVCGFFTISGYLFFKSINAYDFNLKNYYIKRLKSLYLPLIIVTFLTVFTFRYVVDIPWVTIKQETLSVIFGYNNFFQIKANSNYFIRSDASPFTHMWYICILIQIELLLPLVYVGLKKLNYKFNKTHLYVLTIISIVAFVYVDYKYGMAFSYYHTLSRLFSFLIGACASNIDYFESNTNKVIGTLAIIFLILLSGKYASKYYCLFMVLISILSGVLIILSEDYELNNNSVISHINKISYYVYLVQYPVIYIINSLLDINNVEKIIIELLLTVVFSSVLTSASGKLDLKYNKAINIVVSIMVLIGAYGYITCPNYYEEMQDLKTQLEFNQGVLENRQAEYLEKIKDVQTSAMNDIGTIDEALNNLDETVKNTQVSLIGDSIMLGGSFHIDEYFNNCYCDAKGSRNGYLAYETLSSLLNMGVVGDYIVIHLGTNSGLELEEVESINSLLDGQKVIWLTVTNGWRSSMNPMLEEYCETHENNYLADWYNFSLGHKEYFIADGLHLSSDGRYIYDQFIFDSLKEVVKNDLEDKKQALIDNYNEENNDTVSFYGNDLLINLYKELGDDYLYYASSDYDFNSLYDKLKENKNSLCLSKVVYILLDKSVTLSENEINQIKELLSNNIVHIYCNDISILSNDCYLEDDVHLNEKGNKLLIDDIQKTLD